MAFIDTTVPIDGNDELRALYERQQRHFGYVPNYARVFCHRPHVLELWAKLLSGIKRHMDKRRFELVTFVAAQELRSTLCSLAHGQALLEFFSARDVCALSQGVLPTAITKAEAAMLDFARQIARDASAVTPDAVDRLKQHGFTDAEIFDIAAAAAGRAFFTKVIEGLGVEADAAAGAILPDLRDALAVGRPIAFAYRPVDPPVPMTARSPNDRAAVRALDAPMLEPEGSGRA